VFRALESHSNLPMPDDVPAFATTHELADFLRGQRNDLEAPARRLAPIIGDVIDAIAGLPGCHLARMSGSGATCFGLFASADAASRGAAMLRLARPGWWVAEAPVQT
jgi:4-diphosphocytidyl-2-C-methyl-D-erythritol kinase